MFLIQRSCGTERHHGLVSTGMPGMPDLPPVRGTISDICYFGNGNAGLSERPVSPLPGARLPVDDVAALCGRSMMLKPR
jgi:hypothetical protein